MLDRFKKHLDSSGLLRDSNLGIASSNGPRVLVAYSGGADSTCLLHLLCQLGIDVVAAHLHHGMRASADKELGLCQAFAQELNIPFIAGRADVPLMSRELKLSLEEAGRNARYAFFRNASMQSECQLIATGHTQSDLVETVVFNLARGTGMTGLSGIPESRENIVRPLLPFTREETRAYCEEHRLWFHDDPANVDVNNRRSRIRLNIAPELAQLNPDYSASIARTASLIGEEDRFLNGMAAAALEQAEMHPEHELGFIGSPYEATFDVLKLGHLPPVLLKRAIRLAVRAVGGELDFDQTTVIAEQFAREPGSITAEGGTATADWNDETFRVRDLTAVAPFRYPLTFPGETASDELGWMLTAEPIEPTGEVAPRNALVADFSADEIKGSLYFRNAQSGDQMQPSGFAGRRMLADLMSEAKLSSAIRQRLPIVCDLIGPLWAPGVCYDQRLRPSAATKRAVRMAFGPVR